MPKGRESERAKQDQSDGGRLSIATIAEAIVLGVITAAVLWFLGRFAPSVPEARSLLNQGFLGWVSLGAVLVILGLLKRSWLLLLVELLPLALVAAAGFEHRGRLWVDSPTTIDIAMLDMDGRKTLDPRPRCKIRTTLADRDEIKDCAFYLDGNVVHGDELHFVDRSSTRWELTWTPTNELLPVRHTVRVEVTDRSLLGRWKTPEDKAHEFQVRARESLIAGGSGSIVESFFGTYIVGSLEAGVVATGIGGYWTRLATGLVMGASVVLNIILGETREKGLSETLKKSVFLKGVFEGKY